MSVFFSHISGMSAGATCFGHVEQRHSRVLESFENQLRAEERVVVRIGISMRGAGDAQALAQAGQLVTEAARATIAELKQATASVAQVQSILRRATPWVSWQDLALIAAGCAVLVLAVWIAVAWRRELGELRDQKAVLEAEIPTLQATADELTAKGGKIKLSACGKDRRKCVKVNIGMGTFGKAGESYMILDGY